MPERHSMAAASFARPEAPQLQPMRTSAAFSGEDARLSTSPLRLGHSLGVRHTASLRRMHSNQGGSTASMTAVHQEAAPAGPGPSQQHKRAAHEAGISPTTLQQGLTSGALASVTFASDELPLMPESPARTGHGRDIHPAGGSGHANAARRAETQISNKTADSRGSAKAQRTAELLNDFALAVINCIIVRRRPPLARVCASCCRPGLCLRSCADMQSAAAPCFCLRSVCGALSTRHETLAKQR